MLFRSVVFRSNKDGILSLVDQGFAEFPQIVLTFGHVLHLDLSDNYIPGVPDEIAKMSNLSVLVLTGNVLEQLPVGLSGLVNLRLLHRAYNLISYISPESVCSIFSLFENLKSFNSIFQFLFFSFQISGLNNLEELHLEFNKLTSLPPLHNLSEFYFDFICFIFLQFNSL